MHRLAVCLLDVQAGGDGCPAGGNGADGRAERLGMVKRLWTKI